MTSDQSCAGTETILGAPGTSKASADVECFEICVSSTREPIKSCALCDVQACDAKKIAGRGATGWYVQNGSTFTLPYNRGDTFLNTFVNKKESGDNPTSFRPECVYPLAANQHVTAASTSRPLLKAMQQVLLRFDIV